MKYCNNFTVGTAYSEISAIITSRQKVMSSPGERSSLLINTRRIPNNDTKIVIEESPLMPRRDSDESRSESRSESDDTELLRTGDRASVLFTLQRVVDILKIQTTREERISMRCVHVCEMGGYAYMWRLNLLYRNFGVVYTENVSYTACIYTKILNP